MLSVNKNMLKLPAELIICTAENPKNLLEHCQKMLMEGSSSSFEVLARHSQEHFDPRHLARLAIVANDTADLQEKLKYAIDNFQTEPNKSFSLSKGIYYGYGLNPGRVAFLFPGQGSQYLEMGADILAYFQHAKSAWNEVPSFLSQEKCSLHEVVFPKPTSDISEKQEQERLLTATEWAQPALAITSFILLELLNRLRIYPDCVAGHSFGELTALCAAKAMDEKTLLLLARKRGEFMQAAQKTPGAMLCVLCPVDSALALIESHQLDITPANFNSPKQLVLSGSIEAIAAAEECFSNQKIKCIRLPVSAAFHSPSMNEASEKFRAFVEPIIFESVKTPVYANTTSEPYPADPQHIKAYLADQLVKPVQFSSTIEHIYQTSVRTFIEVGPQAVLSGLVKQCLGEREFQAVHLDRKNEHGVTTLWHALGKLMVAGLNPHFPGLWEQE